MPMRLVGALRRSTTSRRRRVGVAEPEDWIAALTAGGVEQDRAMVALHDLMLRASRHQVNVMSDRLADASPTARDDIANLAADNAMMSLLRKLDTFEGRSRFTTWAYKFAILEAATEIRRRQWQYREVELRDIHVTAMTDHPSSGPAQLAEANDLAAAVARGIHEVLTPHQRKVVIAALVDEVPIDVLAERFATNRGALYKTIHDARKRLRAHLIEAGYEDSFPDSTPSRQPEAGDS